MHAHSHHDEVETIARSAVGAVTRCSCGVVTLTMQYISLRFEASAFQDLQALLTSAQHRMDCVGASAPALTTGAADTPPVH